MPIGSVHKSSADIGVAFDYDLSEGRFSEHKKSKKPEIVLSFNIWAEAFKEIKAELIEHSKENQRLKNKALRFSINFDAGDTTPEQVRRDFVKNVMLEMGIDEENHQVIVTKHNDKHPHYHVLANRVGFDGKTLSDSHTKRRLELAIDKWEKLMNLDNSLSKTRAFIYDAKSEKGYKTQKRGKIGTATGKDRKQKMPKLDYIQQEIKRALENKVTSAEELKDRLKPNGIEFKFTANKKGLSGTSFKFENNAVKGSKIGFKASVLSKAFEENKYSKQFALIDNELLDKRIEEIKKQAFKNKHIKEFKEFEKNIFSSVNKKLSEGEILDVSFTDAIIREKMKEIAPDKNVWETLRTIGGEDWEHKFLKKIEEKNAENIKRHKEKEEEKRQKEEIKRKELEEKFPKAIKLAVNNAVIKNQNLQENLKMKDIIDEFNAILKHNDLQNIWKVQQIENAIAEEIRRRIGQNQEQEEEKRRFRR